MAFFNLPFGVRIAGNDPIDGDRYLASDLTARDALIGSGREFDGLQVFVESNKTLFLLEDKTIPTWKSMGSGAIGATNGLSKTGENISLGGSLIENTDILGNNHILTLGTAANKLNGLFINTEGIAISGGFAGLNNSSSFNFVGGKSIWDAKDTLNNLTTSIEINDFVSNIGIITLKDEIGNFGAKYAADYGASGSLDDRWIPDWGNVKAYVDSSSGAIGATNGLSRIGDNISLGGALNPGTTVITGNGGNILAIGDSSSSNSIALFTVQSEFGTFLKTTSGNITHNIVTTPNDTQISTQDSTSGNQINIKTSIVNSIEFDDNINNFGAKYVADYGTTGSLDDRWIPDWGNVKSLISSEAYPDFLGNIDIATNDFDITFNGTTIGDSLVPYPSPGTFNFNTGVIGTEDEIQETTEFEIDESGLDVTVIEADTDAAGVVDTTTIQESRLRVSRSALTLENTDANNNESARIRIGDSLAAFRFRDELTNNDVEIGVGINGIEFEDSINNFGAFYSSDYGTTGSLNDRWIPDWGNVKAYTDSAITDFTSINIRGTYNNTDSTSQVVPNPTFQNGTGGWYSDDTLTTEVTVYDGNNQWTTSDAYLDKALFVDGEEYTIIFTSVNFHPPFVTCNFGLNIVQNFAGGSTTVITGVYVDDPSVDWGLSISGFTVTLENFTVTLNDAASYPTPVPNGTQIGTGSGATGQILEYDAWKAVSDITINGNQIKEGQLIVAKQNNPSSTDSNEWNILEWNFSLNRQETEDATLNITDSLFKIEGNVIGNNAQSIIEMDARGTLFTEPYVVLRTYEDVNDTSIQYFQGNFAGDGGSVIGTSAFGYSNGLTQSRIDVNELGVVVTSTVTGKGAEYETNSLASIDWALDDLSIPSIGLIKANIGSSVNTIFTGGEITTNSLVDINNANELSIGYYTEEVTGGGFGNTNELFNGVEFKNNQLRVTNEDRTLQKATGFILSDGDARYGYSNGNGLDSIFLKVTETEFLVEDSISNFGMKYVADYGTTGSLDDRWIPDYGAIKAYADSVGATAIGATNGLTKTGSDIELGGTLSKVTTIDTDSNNFTISTGAIQLGDKASQITLTPQNTIVFATQVDTTFDGSPDSASSFVSSGEDLRFNLANPSGLSFLEINNNEILLQDDRNEFGAKYAADYGTTGSLDDRWIPDWGNVKSYADSVSVSIGATNGLTKTGDNIELGGELTDNINFSGLWGVNFGASGSPIGGFNAECANQFNLGSNPIGVQTSSQIFSFGGLVRLIGYNDNDFTGTSTSIEVNDVFGSGGKILLTDSIANFGAYYAADYGTTGSLDDRWIPDYGAVKAYVDSSISKYTETLTSLVVNVDNTITHNLNDTDILVTIWDETTGEIIYPKISNRTLTTIDVTFIGSIPTGDIRIIIKK